MGINNSTREIGQFTSTSIGGEIVGFTINHETRNYDSDINPMATRKEMLGRRNTESDFDAEFSLKYLVASKPVESDYMFIGFNLDLSDGIPMIFNLRIGFNIKVS